MPDIGVISFSTALAEDRDRRRLRWDWVVGWKKSWYNYLSKLVLFLKARSVLRALWRVFYISVIFPISWSLFIGYREQPSFWKRDLVENSTVNLDFKWWHQFCQSYRIRDWLTPAAAWAILVPCSPRGCQKKRSKRKIRFLLNRKICPMSLKTSYAPTLRLGKITSRIFQLLM